MGLKLPYYPHIHVLCTGGGLDGGGTDTRKRVASFLPVKEMAALFKGKFLDGLKELHEAGNLGYEGEAARYRDPYELVQHCLNNNE